MSRYAIFTVGLGVFFFHFGQYWSATWWSKWTFLGIAFSTAFAYWASRRTHWMYLPLVLWVSVSSTVTAFQGNRLSLSGVFQLQVLQILEKNALYTLLTVLGSIWLFTVATTDSLELVPHLFATIWAIGTAAYCLIPDLPSNGWYFGNPSMGASLLACLVPAVWGLVAKRGKYVALTAVLSWFLTAVAVHRTHTMIPVAVFATVSLVYLLYALKLNYRVGSFLLLAGGLFSGLAYASGKSLLDTNGRLPIWKLAYTWTRDHGMIWTGLGAGSVQTIVPLLQVQTNTRMPDFFIWLHSDWLQVVVEYGWVGLACSLLALYRLTSKALRSGRGGRVACLAGFVALGLVNYPLRLPIHAFCLLLLCCLIEKGAQSAPRTWP